MILEPVKEDVSEKLDQIKCTRIHSVGRGIVVSVNVNNKECSGVIDTGGDSTVISSALQDGSFHECGKWS